MIASAQVIAKSFPFDPFLHRKSHISQGECDSISQIATKTKQMLPFLTINCPTSRSEKYYSSEIGKISAWNREQLSIYDPCTERSLWRVDPPVEKAWDMVRSRCQFWHRLALAIMPTLIHEQRALLCYIWSSNHFWARHFVIGRIPQNSFDFLFILDFFISLVPCLKYHRFVCTFSLVFKGLWAWCRND